MADGRRRPRAPLDREAVAYVGNSQAECRTLDVSVGGIALSTRTAHESGQFARLSWAFAAGQRVDADIVIVRVDRRADEYILGAAFLRIDANVTNRIAELVLSLSPTQPGGNSAPIVPAPPSPDDAVGQRMTPTSYSAPVIREPLRHSPPSDHPAT